MSWAARRKLIFTIIIIVILAVVIGLPAFFSFYHAPTCFDGVQNQGEEGVDCGGPCAKLCQASFAAPQELWATSSEVVSGIYNLLAYVANPNGGVAATNVPYDFKLYDSQGVLITERAGETNIPAQNDFAVFEPTVSSGSREPYRTFFEFTGAPEWASTTDNESLSIISSTFTTASSSSRVDLSVQNPALYEKDNIEATAILYGVDGNVLAFSKTLISSIASGATMNVSFTWPYPITATIAKKEFLFKTATP